jgi:hypothetical protein
VDFEVFHGSGRLAVEYAAIAGLPRNALVEVEGRAQARLAHGLFDQPGHVADPGKLGVVMLGVYVAEGVAPGVVLVQRARRPKGGLVVFLLSVGPVFGGVVFLAVHVVRVERVQGVDNALRGGGEPGAQAEVIRQSSGVCPQRGVGHWGILLLGLRNEVTIRAGFSDCQMKS